MYVATKHRAARKRSPLRNHLIGLALASSATAVIGIGVTAPAHAAGTVWDRVAACESGGRWTINTGNGYYGGLQFSTSTWLAFGGGRYAPTANRASKAAQIAIAQRVLTVQGPGAWPVCGRQAGLTRATGGARTVAVSRAVSRAVTRAPLRAGLVVDGKMGPKTVRQIQRWVGTRQNGVLGSATVKALQRKVGVRADGAIGPRTVRALQTKIGARRDGARRLNAATVASLQRYLNRH
jgi:peptidoglycan hydrolase-like protein with peptidoglycan-binding domain